MPTSAGPTSLPARSSPNFRVDIPLSSPSRWRRNERIVWLEITVNARRGRSLILCTFFFAAIGGVPRRPHLPEGPHSASSKSLDSIVVNPEVRTARISCHTQPIQVTCGTAYTAGCLSGAISKEKSGAALKLILCCGRNRRISCRARLIQRRSACLMSLPVRVPRDSVK